MGFFRKQTKWRSFAAIFAAYAVILHAFFGGIVLSGSAAATPFVICHGATDSGSGNGTLPAKQFPCSLCCAVHAAGTLPLSTAEIVFAVAPATPLPLTPPAVLASSPQRSPKLAQAPPANM